MEIQHSNRKVFIHVVSRDCMTVKISSLHRYFTTVAYSGLGKGGEGILILASLAQMAFLTKRRFPHFFSYFSNISALLCQKGKNIADYILKATTILFYLQRQKCKCLKGSLFCDRKSQIYEG